MKKAIITTTINEPTLATKLYASMTDWDLIVVGDTKTPHESYKNNVRCVYLDPQCQERIDKTLSDLIGWKSIQRRNMGFIYALQNGYDTVATVDDDNVPLENWGKVRTSTLLENIPEYSTDFGFFDPLSVTEYPHLWHRGFPLQYIHKKNNVSKKFLKSYTFDIQANLWDGDPDIDAVCRMIYAPECTFLKNEWFTTNCLSPFNSQNTILSRRALKDYFVFPKVGRMDDIFASYIMEKKGYKVLYGPSTVRQDRNEHDITVDMTKEYIGYENVRNIHIDESFIPMESYNRYIDVVSRVA